MFTWIRINGLPVRFVFWTTILLVIWSKVEAVEARAPAVCQMQYLDAHGN
jgi:hypothetical protein